MVVNYNNDNPFTPRDKSKWRLYLKSLPLYHLVVVVHESSVARAKERGARDVMRVYLTADEVGCQPQKLTEETRALVASDVVFVGTWMPERGPFMAELVDRGVPLSIWGDRWPKAPEWGRLRTCWRGPGVYEPREYAAILQSSRVCLGLVPHENLNLHTDRSIQVPGSRATAVRREDIGTPPYVRGGCGGGLLGRPRRVRREVPASPFRWRVARTHRAPWAGAVRENNYSTSRY